MRQLTDSEREARTKKYLEYEKSSKEALTLGEKWAFDAGFTAGLDHAAEQIAALTAERDGLRAEVARLQNSVDTLLAFVNGKITRQELEERIR